MKNTIIILASLFLMSCASTSHSSKVLTEKEKSAQIQDHLGQKNWASFLRQEK